MNLLGLGSLIGIIKSLHSKVHSFPGGFDNNPGDQGWQGQGIIIVVRRDKTMFAMLHQPSVAIVINLYTNSKIHIFKISQSSLQNVANVAVFYIHAAFGLVLSCLGREANIHTRYVNAFYFCS